jgi:hypothetical protein
MRARSDEVSDMNWAAVSAILSALTFLGVVGPGLVMWGKLSERVSGHTARLDDHKKQIAGTMERLGHMDTEIGRLQEWKEGYNAAARISTGNTREIA